MVGDDSIKQQTYKSRDVLSKEKMMQRLRVVDITFDKQGRC